MAVNAGLLALHDSLETLRLYYSSVAALTILGIGLLSPRSHLWRASVMIFYAFNPLVIVSWTIVPQDKIVLFAFLTWILIAFDRRSDLAAWLGIGLLAVYKWISLSFAVPFALWSARRLRSRTLLLACGALVLALVAQQIPYFPESLRAYGRRNAQTDGYPPAIASLSRIPDAIGLYRPFMAQLSVYVALTVTAVLFMKRKLDIKEATVLAILGTYIGLPNESFDRVLLTTLPFLFLISFSVRRWIAIWTVSTVAAFWISENLLADNPGHSGVARIVGSYQSWRHLVAANALLFLLLGYYLYDKRTGRYVIAEDLTGPALLTRLTHSVSRA